VYNHLRFGMKDWSGITYVDYERISKNLLDIGFVNAPFHRWRELRAAAETSAAEKFGRAARAYPEFDGKAFSDYFVGLKSQ
jgi:hypothetical protein